MSEKGVKGVGLVWRRAAGPPMLWLSGMVGASVSGSGGEHLGRLRDVGVRRTRSGPVVEAILVDGDGKCFALPAGAVTRWQRQRLQVSTPRQACRTTRPTLEPEREWLAETVLGKPVLTMAAHTAARRISDVGFRRLRDGRWIVWLVDTRPAWQRWCGLPRRSTPWSVLTRRGVITRRGRVESGRFAHPAPSTAAEQPGGPVDHDAAMPVSRPVIAVLPRQRTCSGMRRGGSRRGTRHVDLPR
ncbi:hypothetical protein GCM10023215_54920 [Pseudonocardia yuanmonensis]|uniref:PRC-barrel domain-containing protein n=1 Tax=Pseudonocardia yuanmonensis TaxID=1095914 RepID=A0ABP8XFM7_9PSEU